MDGQTFAHGLKSEAFARLLHKVEMYRHTPFHSAGRIPTLLVCSTRAAPAPVHSRESRPRYPRLLRPETNQATKQGGAGSYVSWNIRLSMVII